MFEIIISIIIGLLVIGNLWNAHGIHELAKYLEEYFERKQKEQK